MVKRYGTSCTEHPEGIYVLHKDYEALEAEVRALREDKARLDFLIDNEAHVWNAGLGWHVTNGHSDDPQNLEPWDADCESAREAIDAARGAK